MKHLHYLLMLLLGAIMVTGCSDNKAYETSVCALADVSGTYAREKHSMVKLIKTGLLPRLMPGDSIFLITIDSNSYTQDNLVAKMTLDYRPSEVTKQKLAFSKKLDEFAKSKLRSKHTDISGAMMLCSDYLKDTGSGTKMMFVFSDMKEELPAGIKRKFSKDEFKGTDIAAMNVIKLNKDTANPEVFRKRLAHWKKRLDKADAKSWNTIIDPTKLKEYWESIKP
jgi:hypothetical protein